MTDPLQAALQPADPNRNRFPPNSRYHGVETLTLERPSGDPVVYLRRRFAPRPARLTLLRHYQVKAGERLDQIAASVFGDPLLFWRICDANGAMEPQELTSEVGRRLRIALPEGIPGAPDG